MALVKNKKPVEVQTDDAEVSEAAAAPSAAAPSATPEASAPETAAVVEKVDEEVVETEVVKETTEVAETKSSEAVVKSSSHVAAAAGSFTQAAADEGFEDLELGYFSFPVIKLPGEGIFMTSTDEELGKEFNVVITGSKAKFLVKPAGAGEKDKRVAFSYDQKVTTDGKTMEELLAEWAEDAKGCTKLDFKKYLDVPARLVSAANKTGLVDSMVMLSVPPSGIQRFSGYIMELKMKGLSPSQVVTECKVGAKVTATNDFYPWTFFLNNEETKKLAG